MLVHGHRKDHTIKIIYHLYIGKIHIFTKIDSNIFDARKENLYPQHTEGLNDNVELLKTTKDNFICELKQLVTEAESYVISLCDLCFPKC